MYRGRGLGTRWVREQPGAECEGGVLGGCHSGGSRDGEQERPSSGASLEARRRAASSAKGLIRDNENKRAEYVLMRTQADAELAIALSHVAGSNVQAGTAVDEARAVHSGTPTP